VEQLPDLGLLLVISLGGIAFEHLHGMPCTWKKQVMQTMSIAHAPHARHQKQLLQAHKPFGHDLTLQILAELQTGAQGQSVSTGL